MADHILEGDPPVPLVLRRSARARRISLRVSQLDGRVTLTLPPGVPEAAALDFAEEKADWIRGHLSQRSGDVPVRIGAVLPVEGSDCPVVAVRGRSVRYENGALCCPDDARVAARLRGFLRVLARDRLVAASDHYAGLLGLSYSRITLRDTRSRWGSCSSAGALMYSWRLILAPPEVLRYVAAHEVAHLAEMNHSPRFWQKVQDIHGPYEAPRLWLRENGQDLHRFRFDD